MEPPPQGSLIKENEALIRKREGKEYAISRALFGSRVSE